MRGRPFPFSGFDAGVDLRDSAGETSMKFARDALNVTSRRAGIVETRPGCQQFNVAAPNTGNFNIYGAIIKDQPLLIGSQHSGTTAITTMLKAYTPGGTQVATQTLGTNGLAPQRAEWITAPYIGAQGPCYGLVQVQDNLGQIGILPRYFTANAFGTWTATSGTLPLGTMMLYHGNRVIIAGNPASPSTLYASDVGNPTDWDTTDGGSWAVDLDPADGEPITGIGTVGQDLLVFKRDKIFLVYGLDTGGENRRVVSNIGCVSHRSIVESPYGTFFLGPDGVYLTDGTRVQRVSDLVDPLLNNIVVGWRPYAAGAWFNDRYYLSVELYNFAGGGGSIPRTLEYNPQTKAWWIHNFHAWQWSVWHTDPRVAQDKLFGISSGTLRPPEYDVGLARNAGNPAAVPNGYFQAMVTTGAGDPGGMNSYWKGAWTTLGAPFVRKRIRGVLIESSGAHAAALMRDYADPDDSIAENFAQTDPTAASPEVVLFPQAVGPIDGNLRQKRATGAGVARAVSLGIDGNQSWALQGFTVLADMRKD